MPNKPTIVQKYSIMSPSNVNKNNVSKKFATLLFIFALSLLSGCASTSSTPSEKSTLEKSTLEKANRAILKFNLATDRKILKPVAKAYTRVVPKPLRKGVTNFFSNLWQPMTVLNDILQGKLGYAVRDTSRFLINSTIGVLGIFDVATKSGLTERREDFGQTLAVWGVPSGPYLVLPFLGPSNLRDTVGLIPQFTYADAVDYIESPESYYAQVLRLVDARTKLLGADDLLDLQPDKYLFIREAYRHQRAALISDVAPLAAQEQESEDTLIDQLLEDN